MLVQLQSWTQMKTAASFACGCFHFLGYTTFMKRKTDESYGVVPVIKESGVWYFLLVHQISYRGKNDQFWTFPKGHAEGVESTIETAKRELLEETGISGVVIDEATTFSISYNFKHQGTHIDKTVSYYLGVCSSKETNISQPEEIAGLEWCTYDEAMQKLSHQNAKNVLNEAKLYIESNTI